MVGRLGRRQIGVEADDGEAPLLYVPVFSSDEWPGPNVIGWKGCLERLRVGLDATSGWFYFGCGNGTGGIICSTAGAAGCTITR